jgi:hypothetical protein
MPQFSYASSWTDIANQALKALQKQLIDTMENQTSVLAGYCRQFMGEAVDLSLAETGWRGATALALLNRLTETPAFGYGYFYQLPTDYSRFETVGPEGILYLIVGDKVATDSETVELTYIARPADPAKLPPHLRNLIASTLAKLLTIPVSSSDALKAEINRQHASDLEVALRAEVKTRKDPEQKDDLGFTYYDELR